MMHEALLNLVTDMQLEGIKINKQPYCLECRTVRCDAPKRVFNTALRFRRNTVYLVVVHNQQ